MVRGVLILVAALWSEPKKFWEHPWYLHPWCLHHSVYDYRECWQDCKRMVDIFYTVNHFRIDLIRGRHTNCGFVSKESVFMILENKWNSQSYGELPQALKSTITAFFQENNYTGALATLKVSSFFYRFVFLIYLDKYLWCVQFFLVKPPSTILTRKNYRSNSIRYFVQIGS